MSNDIGADVIPSDMSDVYDERSMSSVRSMSNTSNTLKRSPSQYFRDNITYDDVEFPKPKALERKGLVTCISHLVEMAVGEKMRKSFECQGFQANPFLQYMKVRDASQTNVYPARLLDLAATVFLVYASGLGRADADDTTVSFESSGFKGGMFSKIEFVGPMEPVNKWLQITEEPLKCSSRDYLKQEYRDYRYTFAVIG